MIEDGDGGVGVGVGRREEKGGVDNKEMKD